MHVSQVPQPNENAAVVAAALPDDLDLRSPGAGPGARGGIVVTVLFSAATFLGAFLLFLVQPLIAKYILPWFGGGAAVWATCMLFFQTALLAGYLYAHLGVRRLGGRAQAAVHAALLVGAAAAALPAIVPSTRWQPPADAAGANPTWRILLLLTATVGLPCVALAATSPLLHTWYSRIRPGAAVYRLFALSNLGSMLALLAYPFVVEPLLPRRTQAAAWSVALAVFAALCAACAWLAVRHRGDARETVSDDAPAPAGDDPRPAYTGVRGPVRGVLWLALPACASALLLGTTNAMTHDFAPIPFLWVLPLALYLLTFVVAFDHPRWYHRTAFGWALVASTAVAVWLVYTQAGDVPLIVLVGGLALAVFVGCMVLHGELARLRPDPRRLTGYYLTIAAGGALGGLLVAVAAPLLLRSYSELQIAIWVCCFLAFLVPLLDERRPPSGIPGLLGIAALSVLAVVLWGSSNRTLPGAKFRTSMRDFYGVLTIWDTEGGGGGKGVLLQHSGTTHGHQFRRPALRATPSTYYHPGTGVGLVLGEGTSPLPPGPRRVGLVGLGGGTLAAYARAGDTYRFYEINPTVVRVAREAFTYLGDAQARGATVDVILGDGRLSLEREPDQQFDVLVLDAFSGDAIPVHLLTMEAFELYRRHLKPGGVLCVHVSNHYLALDAVTLAAAARLGWGAVLRTTEFEGDANFPSVWVLLSPDRARLAALHEHGVQQLSQAPLDLHPWTDEHANVLGVARRPGSGE